MQRSLPENTVPTGLLHAQRQTQPLARSAFRSVTGFVAPELPFATPRLEVGVGSWSDAPGWRLALEV